MDKKQIIVRYAAGIPVFILAALLKVRDLTGLSSVLFFLLALTEAAFAYLESRNILDARIYLSLTWLGSLGLAVLGLSELQNPWVLKTWLSVGGFYFLFSGAYDLTLFRMSKKVPKGEKAGFPAERDAELPAKRTLQAALLVFAAGFLCFMAESVVFSFDYPFFSDKPHAYTSFHITGLHYFVVSVVFVHPLTVYACLLRTPGKKEKVIFFLINVLSLLISVLILSKFQLLFGLEMSLVVWILFQKRFTGKQIFLFSCLAAAAFIAGSTLMILMRKYPDDYLRGIFAFKDPSAPLPFQYVYTYMVNNFENLNLLIRDSGTLTLGKRCVYPFLCLTGLKFVTPILRAVWVPMYFTCEELTTLTLLYDAVGDFGLFGAAALAAGAGALTAAMAELSHRKGGVFSALLFAELLLYLFLAFFSTWFSNPTVWFGFAYTVMIAGYIEWDKVANFLRRNRSGDR